MAIAEGMTPLDPKQLTLLRIRGTIAAVIMVAGTGVADLALLRGTAVPPGLVSAAAFVAAVLAVAVLPARRYRAWGYRMDEDELHLAYGVWTRVHTIVPFGRVQHIDVVQGPLQRGLGLGTLVLHTAGTATAAVHLPGLAWEEAGRMRDVIRAKVREDLA